MQLKVPKFQCEPHPFNLLALLAALLCFDHNLTEKNSFFFTPPPQNDTLQTNLDLTEMIL